MTVFVDYSNLNIPVSNLFVFSTKELESYTSSRWRKYLKKNVCNFSKTTQFMKRSLARETVSKMLSSVKGNSNMNQ